MDFVPSCIICATSDNVINSIEIGTNSVEWKTKLKFCMPELDWNILCFLCKECTGELDGLCNFRNKCLASYLTRKDIIEVDRVDVKCKLCLADFNFRNELIEHNKLVHHSETPHDCLLCTDSFNSPGQLVIHESLHYQLQKFYCDDCNTGYPSLDDLLNHRAFKHGKLEDWDAACPHCSVVYPNEDHLKKHIENLHENSVSFSCFHCQKKFSKKNVLISHIKAAHEVRKEYTCGSCNSVHSTKKKLEIHRSTCNVSEDYEPDVSDSDETKPKKRGRKPKEKTVSTCERCGITFSTKYLLNRHLRNVHATEKKHNCDVCGQKFASPVYLAAHKKYHSGNRPHMCSFCGKGYITASDLYHHEKIHANKRAYKCEKCPKAFNTSSDLHKHRICVHVDRALWKYVCSYCDRRFPLKTNLDTHTKTHTGERNYPCHLCERRCINKSVLQRHIESHSNVRSFKCSHCNQDYKYQNSLDIHLAKVHGIGDTKIPERVKKYFCHFCPKTYFANNKLQKHIRTHTGERPFSCQMCAKTFIDKSYVKQHLKIAHNVVLAQ